MPLLCSQLPISRDDPEPPRGLPGTLLGLGGVLLSHAISAVVGNHLPIPTGRKAQVVIQLLIIQIIPVF